MTKTKLINERVIRRWGKLANMPSLTENFLDSIEEDAMEDEMAGAEDEMAAGEDEMEAGMEAEASVEEVAAVENIVQAVVDAIAAETGVDIEVEGGADDEGAMDDMDAGMDASDEMDDAADDEMDDAMRDEDPAMRNMAYNRKDITETGAKRDGESKGDKGKGKHRDEKDYEDGGDRKGDKSKTHAGVDETLELEVIDDEALTEAVLKRVVERLLKKS